MQSCRFASIQMISGPDVAANLARAGALIAQAAQAGAQCVALPEYFAIMGERDTDKLAVQEDYQPQPLVQGSGPIQQFLARMAQQYGIWLVGGTVPLRSEEPARVMNSCLVYSPAGECVTRYDKIHLFGFQNGSECFQEADTIRPGTSVVTVPTPFGRLGLAVCYDLRFPELFRQAGEVDIWVVPAAFTATTGRAHWEILLRARAIENQCFVVASGQGGTHPSGRSTFGHSMLIDPWGMVLDVLPTGEGVVLAELKASQAARVRTILPALRHRVL
ncbi:carbon-nitrogen hydrolase family protein [Chitinibacter tainanensis]|uniref:carbon-nitrogen hydrolase family protein n=1 Tax=Chitinibacter tainanensis TaxID=230667 RepID=UPI002357745A|nr:carbon-nitrogen hydrolase family protein [Chitinibacter tainanensis]